MDYYGLDNLPLDKVMILHLIINFTKDLKARRIWTHNIYHTALRVMLCMFLYTKTHYTTTC